MQLLIAVKELIPILIAALVWGRSWSGQKVLCHYDNQVAAIRSRLFGRGYSVEVECSTPDYALTAVLILH